MKAWQYWIGVVLVIAILVVVASLIPDGELAFRQMLSVLLGVAVWVSSVGLLLGVLFLSFVIGLLLPYLFQRIDNRVETDKRMTGAMKFLYGFLLSLVVGVIWVLLIPLVVQNFLVRGVFGAFSHEWNGHYESSPILWGLYAWMTSLFCFLVNGGAED
jgi:uncharacterized protein YqgC (DUF456 family)